MAEFHKKYTGNCFCCKKDYRSARNIHPRYSICPTCRKKAAGMNAVVFGSIGGK